MKYLLACTGVALLRVANEHVIYESRINGTEVYDALTQNRAEDFLAHSELRSNLQWLKFESRSLPRAMREHCDAVFEIGNGGIPTPTKLRHINSALKDSEEYKEVLAVAMDVFNSETPWFSRKDAKVEA